MFKHFGCAVLVGLVYFGGVVPAHNNHVEPRLFDLGYEISVPAQLFASKPVRVDVTAYSAKKKQNVHRLRGASGHKLHPGSCAVSQDLLGRHFDYGDIIHVEGVGRFVVLDTMAPHMRKSVDVFLPTKADAKRFGRKVDVAVISF